MTQSLEENMYALPTQILYVIMFYSFSITLFQAPVYLCTCVHAHLIFSNLIINARGDRISPKYTRVYLPDNVLAIIRATP